MGGGVKFALSDSWNIAAEAGVRRTFTDYIDDASTVYASDYDGISNKTTQELVDDINAENGFVKGDEGFLFLNSFDTGSKRGDSEHNDSYLTATVNFSWAIRGKSNFYKSRHNWVLGKSKRKRRKSRAKF